MSKLTGLGMTFSAEDSSNTPVNIENDVNDFNANQSRALIDVTGIDKDAFERLGGLKDAELDIKGTFNPALSHLVFSDTDNLREFIITYPGPSVLTITVAIESYNVQRANNGALTWQVKAKIADGSTPAWS